MKPTQLNLSGAARASLQALRDDPSRKAVYNAVVKALNWMAVDLRHPGLNTHPFSSMDGPRGEKVFEAYAQNRTPGAWRIFFYYGPERGEITVLAITPHP